MICPGCGYDTLEVRRTMREDKSDKRIVECIHCHAYYRTITQIDCRLTRNLETRDYEIFQHKEKRNELGQSN